MSFLCSGGLSLVPRQRFQFSVNVIFISIILLVGVRE